MISSISAKSLTSVIVVLSRHCFRISTQIINKLGLTGEKGSDFRMGHRRMPIKLFPLKASYVVLRCRAMIFTVSQSLLLVTL